MFGEKTVVYRLLKTGERAGQGAIPTAAQETQGLGEGA